ncbi:TPA: hypothetical protein N0F65_001222 [Lagenidium giganteum]|uniref:EF-hand domain-containing protein n=1 Tax=Lagenidium giganteum TaxID=4803 RepID=A0AAV2Z3A2_9STRA|nr:TPA: hypothetical protein N0F65_001222 [Lagenidium giganteum]
MQFTPQQLVGAGRYAPCTRIGNWNEDLMLEEARMKEFQLRKKQGSLLATHKLKQDFLHQPAPRSYDAQQRIRFNQAVGIYHSESDGVLSCNVFEETPSIGSGEFLVTVCTPCKGGAAAARNVFRIVSPTAWKEQQGTDQGFACGKPSDVLRYGDPFFLMCDPALLVDDQSVLLKPALFVKSGLKTDRSMSPITYNQRVWLSAEPDSSALWTCVRADLAGTAKMLAAGDEVVAGDAIAIVHKMTGQPLCAEKKSKQPTDFGVEIEVCGFGMKKAGKCHNLIAEEEGTRTADTEGRASLSANTWTFLLAQSPAEAQDARHLPDAASPASIIRVMQQCLTTESIYAFRKFVTQLKRADAKGTGYISAEELRWLVMQQQMPLREEHLDVLLAALDKKHTGHVSLRDLLARLRAPTPPARMAQMEAAFDRLVGSKTDGKLTVAALAKDYDTPIDSRVRAKQLTEAQALDEYRELWFGTQAADITRRDFVEVYSDISAVLGSDAHFQQLLAESWR